MRRFSLLLCAAMLLAPLVLLAQPSYEYFSRPGWFRAFANPAPTTPQNMAAVTMGADLITLYWDASDFGSGELDRYDIYWCQPSPCTPTLQATSTTNSYDATGLTPAVVYEFSVVAVNTIARESEMSGEAVASLADLVAYFPLNADGDDASSTNADCTLNGDGTFVAGVVGNAYSSVDGTGDYCAASHNAALNSASVLTVQVRIDTNSLAATGDVFFSRSNGTDQRQFEVRVGSSTHQASCAFYDSTNTLRVASANNVFPASGFVRVTCRYDGTAVTLHADGTLRATTAFVGTLAQPTIGATVGARSTGGASFAGLVDEARVWTRALTDDDILGTYTLSTPQQVTSTVLSENTNLSGDLPAATFHRKENEKISSYTTWKTEFGRLGGMIQKGLNEDTAWINAATMASYLNQYAVEFPEQTVILHFAGRERDPTWRPSAYSPQHFIWLPGSIIDANLATDTTTIPVDDTNKFKVNMGQTGTEEDDLVIYRLDGSGDPIWTEFEYAKLVSIGTGEITVLRAQLGTTALTYTANEAYIAPASNGGPWGAGSVLVWAYNFGGPEDANGDAAEDVLSAEIAALFETGGEFAALDGIELDIAPWTHANRLVQGRLADTDNDGTGDGGIISGVNVYGQGVAAFYTQLRALMGPDKLLLADGAQRDSQRVVSAVGGIESEGWDDPLAVYEEWSKSLNFFSYWQTHGLYRPQYNYVSHRDPSPNGGTEVGKERLILGAASCLGIQYASLITTTPETGFTYGIRDELVGGTLQTKGWLGARVGSIIYPTFAGTDVFADDTLTGAATNGTLETIGTTYFLSDPTADEMLLSFASVDIPEGDVTVTLDARSFDPLPGQATSIPRQIRVELNGKEASTHTADTVYGYMGINALTTSTFYFREAGAVTTGSTVTLEIYIEGGGTTDRDPFAMVRNIKAYSGPQAMACEFEEGVILVNPGLDDYDFDLSTLFPGKAYAKIQATSLQDTTYNDGSAVSGTVTVPGLNALFLDRTF